MASRPDSKRPPDATFRRRRVSTDLNSPASREAILSLTALGVVYGDIGTSPLYAFRACFGPEYGLPRTSTAVYGVLSLIVWALILIVSVNIRSLTLFAFTNLLNSLYDTVSG